MSSTSLYAGWLSHEIVGSRALGEPLLLATGHSTLALWIQAVQVSL